MRASQDPLSRISPGNIEGTLEELIAKLEPGDDSPAGPVRPGPTGWSGSRSN